MNDERLVLALRALDRPVAVDPAFGEALYGRLAGERARRRFRPRVTLLLVAALLAALAIGGALAVGSGLLRLPWISDRSLVLGGSDCGAKLPAGQLLELDVHQAGGAWVGERWRPAGFRIRIYDDGLLLDQRPIARSDAQVRDADSGMTARRLSPTGIRLVMEAVDAAVGRGGLGSGCHERWVDILPRPYLGTYVSVSVRLPDGDAGQVRWGDSGIRQTTEEELAAVDRLVGGLDDPAAWLPPEAWIDATERPYVPDRWLVNVDLSAGDPFADPQPWPAAEAVVLPSGTALLALGDPYTEPDDPANPEWHGRHGRCTVVDADTARSMEAQFADAGAGVYESRWWFRSGADPVVVQIVPLLFTDEPCTALVLGSDDPSPPRPEPTGDLAAVDPCGFLSEAGVQAALAIPPTTSIRFKDVTDHLDLLGPDFRVCGYNDNSDGYYYPLVSLHVRTWSTRTEDARVLAHQILGGGAVEEAYGDRRVWRNDCLLDPNSPAWAGLKGCSPAIAIAKEPHFIVVAIDTLAFLGPMGATDPPSVLRALMSAVLFGE